MPNTDPIAQLRAELAHLSGPARLGDLVRLGQALLDQYWRVGPGRPQALPVLNDAVAALDEAYRYLELTDPMRGQVAALLGWVLGARHGAHGGGEQDRTT